MLHGRQAEQLRIDELLDAARAGRSGVLVLRGEAGIGKTALLDYAAAQGITCVRGAGIESEAELPFAGLHLLLRPGMELVRTLPERQRAALLGAFGLGEQQAGDQLLIGLAVLTLLAEEAADGPLLVLIDDAHWLDRATADTLLFVARRLEAEGIAVVFATRAGAADFPAPGLPELEVRALRQDAAAALVDAADPDLPPALRYRLLSEAGGNPLALRELPAVLAAESAGAGPNPLPLGQRLQVAFHGRVSRLPAATRTLLLLAAAAGSSELDPLLRAAASLGAGLADLQPAEEDGLVYTDGRTLDFRHPLLRSAVYQGAPLAQRLAAHGALAAALDRPEDADLRAWHRASAATGPDEDIAGELAATADRARARTGYHGAVAAYERAAALSADPVAKVNRLVLAAETAGETGLYELADRLAGRAAAQTADPALAARLDLIRGRAEFGAGKQLSAHRRLVAAADAAHTQPLAAARMLMVAVHTAWYLGDGELREVTERLAKLSLPEDDSLSYTTAYVLDGVHGRFHADLRATAERARATGADVSDLVQLSGVGLVVGQDEQVAELAGELIAACREEGRIGPLPTLLFFRAEAESFLGRPREALVIATEGARIARDTRQEHWVGQHTAMLAYLAALDGREDECRAAAEESMAERFGGADAPGAAWARAALGLLELGLGRVDSALARFESLTREPARHMVIGLRCLPDLIEAAVRLGDPARAGDALDRLDRWAEVSRQPWVAALAARARALAGPDAAAEQHYRTALDLGGRPFEQARTQLLYGEWLRRNRRKVDARTQLTSALETFERLGAAPWAGRATTELGALGVGTAARTATGVLATLTPQELQIVRLAAQGLSNRDIAAQLFLSPRTVGHHLYKAYPKLGVVSRGELNSLALDQN
ncbi:AAA family ATPase [Nocardia sp. NPDC057668]|uniref:helix-turn-helix transcriptional regulator n=1 Tax=Nocardia sp. NPDC057668 TaxID=3346202 RepID=UPI00366DB7D2